MRSVMTCALILLPLAICSTTGVEARQPQLLYQVDHPEPGPPVRTLGEIATALDGQLFLGERANTPSAQGSVYLLDAVDGSLQQTYVNPRPQPLAGPISPGFGGSVAVSSRHLAVGASGFDFFPPRGSAAIDVGAAYLFSLETGDLLHTIENPNPTATERFGGLAALTDDFFATSSRITVQVDTPNRLVDVFDVQAGTHRFTLTNPLSTRSAGFGSSLGVVGEDLLVTAVPSIDHPYPGALFRFNGQTGELLQTFRSPINNSTARLFGASHAITKDRIVIGNPRSFFGPSDGLLYIFGLENGSLLHTIQQPESDTSVIFGGDLAVVGDFLVTNSIMRLDGGSTRGRVYVYDSTTYELLSTLEHPHDVDEDRFGDSLVSLGDNRLFVGSPTFTGIASGFVYDLSGISVPEPSSGLLAMLCGTLVCFRPEFARDSRESN